MTMRISRHGQQRMGRVGLHALAPPPLKGCPRQVFMRPTRERQVSKVSAVAPGTPVYHPKSIDEPSVASVRRASAPGRRIVFAVDGTSDAREGCDWLAKNILRSGSSHILIYFARNIQGSTNMYQYASGLPLPVHRRCHL
jgi:hypothetical protein